MRRLLLLPALGLLVACGSRSDGGGDGISDAQRSDLVQQCTAADPGRDCQALVDQLVPSLEDQGCPFDEVERALEHALVPAAERDAQFALDCD